MRMGFLLKVFCMERAERAEVSSTTFRLIYSSSFLSAAILFRPRLAIVFHCIMDSRCVWL